MVQNTTRESETRRYDVNKSWIWPQSYSETWDSSWNESRKLKNETSTQCKM